MHLSFSYNFGNLYPHIHTSVMLISFTIIFCIKAHGIFSVSFSTRLWESVFYFWSSLEYSFTQAALFSALLSGRPQAWRISRHQKLQQRPSRSQIASPLALRKYKCLRYQKQWGKKGIPTAVALHAKREKLLQKEATIYTKALQESPPPPSSPSKNCLLILAYYSEMQSTVLEFIILFPD